MESNEINARIATICGWTYRPDLDAYYPWLNPPGFRYTDSKPHHSVPDFFGDLNCCYEMEETLTVSECYDYASYISQTLGHWNPSDAAKTWPFHADAPTRCRAFLRVHGVTI